MFMAVVTVGFLCARTFTSGWRTADRVPIRRYAVKLSLNPIRSNCGGQKPDDIYGVDGIDSVHHRAALGAIINDQTYRR